MEEIPAHIMYVHRDSRGTEKFLHQNKPPQPQKLDNRVEAVVIVDLQPLQPALAKLIHNPKLKRRNTKPTVNLVVFVDE